ncbi:DUF4199 domain-containing protein [Aquirufa rosea]|uniref:DUF4199 domain-containing protein n=1 Tax=Aquirufa rosea TaxID=2509241 RepID=A0A4Q1C1S9_9BACT|nr:DUF4199 domain-containing protein [Aquirufa rosea]RXK52136.1 DUF4199 domain-containing protein [Aquirufa rosea]
MENHSESNPSTSLIALKWGLIGGTLSFLYTLLTKYTGLEEQFSESLGWITFLVTIGLDTTILFMTLKEFRTQNQGFMGYSQGLGISTLLGALWGLVSGAYNYIYLNFIDTTVLQKQMDLAREKMEEQGLSESQISEAMKVSTMMMGPGVQFVIIVLISTLFIFLLGLIISAVLKKEKPVFE